MQTLPIPSNYADAVRRFEADGYVVEGLCPECQYGLIVRKVYTTRQGGTVHMHTCTAYGQCEYAPG